MITPKLILFLYASIDDINKQLPRKKQNAERVTPELQIQVKIDIQDY